MNDLNEQKLVDRLQREFDDLPGYRAPATLAPRVLAALVARRLAPWWRKAWIEWPPILRLAFLVIGVVVAGGIIAGSLELPQLINQHVLAGGLSGTVSSWFAVLEPYRNAAEHVAGTLALVIRAAPPAALWCLAAIVGLAYATCVALGTLGYRVVFNRM